MQYINKTSYPNRKQQDVRKSYISKAGLELKLSNEELWKLEQLSKRLGISASSIARMIFGLGLEKTDKVYSNTKNNALFISPTLMVSVMQIDAAKTTEEEKAAKG